MPDATDMELVRDFAEHNSEAAFAELVRRHINLVYSVALRFTGNAADAEDITQAVFVILARKASGLRGRAVLTGWIYETTRLAALQFLRTKTRRHRHEQELRMHTIVEKQNPDTYWHQMAPLLEAAMSRLSEKDRTLLALRYFENRSAAECAALLGISEWAAHKRSARALEKLHDYFFKRGVNSTAAIVAATLSTNSVMPAPATLAKSVAVLAIAKGATGSISTLTLVKGVLKTMAWTKMQTAMVAAVGVALVTTGAYETTQAARLNQQNQTLVRQQSLLAAQVRQLQSALGDATNHPAASDDPTGMQPGEKSELLKLRGEAAQTRNLQNELAQLKLAAGSKPAEGSSNLASESNKVMYDYLGEPVQPPANLNFAYTKDGLTQAVQLAARNAGITLKDIQVDDSEFPFVIGVTCNDGDYPKLTEQLKNLSGYHYGGSVSSDASGAFNITPVETYPPDKSDQIFRRLAVRQPMLYKKLISGASS